MKAYKGFKNDMTCRGYKYEEGKTYEEEKAELCKFGFHACEDPLDCFGYYAPCDSVYHVVEMDEVSDERHSNDSNVCAKKITVGARLNFSQLVKAAFDFRFSRAKIEACGHATGDCGTASATGYRGAASATGYFGAASATGKEGVAVALGTYGKVCGAVGCWLVAAEWKKDEKTGDLHRTTVKSVAVDGDKVKADTWYMLKDGEFVEVQDENT